MSGVVVFAAVTIVILFAGLVIGMLVSGRITSWLDRADEEPDDR